MTFPLRRRARTHLAAAALSTAMPGRRRPTPLRVILPVGAGSGVDTIMRAAAGADEGARRPAGRHREPARRRRHHRDQALVKARARRQDDRHRLEQPRDQSERLQEDAVRLLNDITPITVVGSTPFVLVVNPTKVPAKNAKELRLAEGEAGRLQLRVVGQRHDPPPGREMFLDQRRRREAHPVQGRRPDGRRSDRRPGRFGRRRACTRARASQDRRARAIRCGAPAKVVRALTDADVAGLERAAAGYVERGAARSAPARARRLTPARSRDSKEHSHG